MNLLHNSNMTTVAGVPQTYVLRVLNQSLRGKTPPIRAAYPRNPETQPNPTKPNQTLPQTYR